MRPSTATAHSITSQVMVASTTCTHTISAGQLELVLDRADQALGGEQDAEHGERLQRIERAARGCA